MQTIKNILFYGAVYLLLMFICGLFAASCGLITEQEIKDFTGNYEQGQ